MAEKLIRLAPGLELPVDAATGSFGVLGQRGSGKSNVAVVYGEELWKVGVPWVAVDPKGDWWGIRSSADGTGPGLPIPVFGGLHGDIPLEAGAGAYIADLIVDQMLTVVLDVSGFSAGELSGFLIAFCHRLFRRHQQDPHVRVVIFEEGHRYIPQSVTAATAQLKEATAKIPLEGRAFGLGSMTPSQRSSRLHKDVLTQFGTLIAMRSPAKLDRDAIGGWVEEHAVSKELLASLPSLDDGEAWVWSPHDLHVVDRFRFRRRETFDSGATPKVGQAKRQPRSLADIDLGAIKEAMADTIERAKADDPAELRKRIRDLERRLAAAPAAAPERVEIPVPYRDPALVDALGRLEGLTRQAFMRAEDHLERVRELVSEAEGVMSRLPEEPAPAPPASPASPARPVPSLEEASREVQAAARRSRAGYRPIDLPTDREVAARVAEAHAGAAPEGIPGKMLAALARYPEGLPVGRLGALAGASRRKSTFRNALGKLKSAGLVEVSGTPTSFVRATEAGLAQASVEALPSGPQLLAHWRAKLSGAPAAVFEALVAAWPAWMTQEALVQATGIEPGPSTLRNAVGKLKVLGVAEGSLAQGVRADADLMEAVRG